MSGPWITHELLRDLLVPHGFGQRGAPDAPAVLRPRQVHGATALCADGGWGAPAPEADAVVSTQPGRRVGVVTADCVPILLASGSGAAVAAVHAGWRGVARGVVAAALLELRAAAAPDAALTAVVGPHIGACCYEVDAPVLEALEGRLAAELPSALEASRPGHHRLDLGRLVRAELLRGGVATERIGALRNACTRCDPRRFHSYRRDGARAGRLLHFVAARPATAT